MCTDAAGKGKRKIDDIPPLTTNGNVHVLFVPYCVCIPLIPIMFVSRFLYVDLQPMDGCVSDSSVAGNCVAGAFSHFPADIAGIFIPDCLIFLFRYLCCFR